MYFLHSQRGIFYTSQGQQKHKGMEGQAGSCYTNSLRKFGTRSGGRNRLYQSLT